MSQHELFQTFVAIYRAGSISGAAQLRHLTQPAVSQHLAALEAQVGARLFLRGPRGVTATPRGQALYAQIFDPLDRLDQVSRSLRQPPAIDERALLRLGTEAEFFQLVALERLARLPLQLHVTFGEAKEQLAQLEQGVLDAVITTTRPAQRTLQQQVLGEKTYALVGPPALDRPPGGLAPVELGAWLNRQAWVSYSLELPITRRFWQQHLGLRFEARQAVVVPDLRAVLRAVELGYGLSILPAYLCDPAIAAGRVQELWPVRALIPSDRWVLAFRAVDADRPAIRALGEHLRMGAADPH